MDGISAASAILGLTISIFTSAKAVRDKIKQVRDPACSIRYVLGVHSILVFPGRT